jgi:hypothetical protein
MVHFIVAGQSAKPEADSRGQAKSNPALRAGFKYRMRGSTGCLYRMPKYEMDDFRVTETCFSARVKSMTYPAHNGKLILSMECITKK